MYVCMYIYIYVYTHIHTYTYIHLCTYYTNESKNNKAISMKNTYTDKNNNLTIYDITKCDC